MLVHIALFKFKDGTDLVAIDAAMAQIRSLASEVADIEAIYCGENFSRWGEGYTHAVVVLGKTELALEAYRIHPIHTAAARIIEASEERGIGVDFFDPINGTMDKTISP